MSSCIIPFFKPIFIIIQKKFEKVIVKESKLKTDNILKKHARTFRESKLNALHQKFLRRENWMIRHLGNLFIISQLHLSASTTCWYMQHTIYANKIFPDFRRFSIIQLDSPSYFFHNLKLLHYKI